MDSVGVIIKVFWVRRHNPMWSNIKQKAIILAYVVLGAVIALGYNIAYSTYQSLK